MVTDTGRVRIELRRYADAACPGLYGYHNATVAIGEAKAVTTTEGYLDDLSAFYTHDDPRWSKTCDGCPYVFADTDKWQVNQEAIYVTDGNEWIERDLPAGSIREAWWMGAADRGPDGKAYLLRLPGAPRLDWSIYGPAAGARPDGPGWTITGALPNITASPSINAEGVWHGWLNNGVLTP